MDFDPVYQVINGWVAPLLISAAIASARSLGMVLITPAFNRLGMTGLLRNGVVLVISFPVIPLLFQELSAVESLTTLSIGGLIIKELVIGLMLGLIFGIPFWAAELAGELVDIQRGSLMSQLVDPSASSEVGVTSTLLSITIIALFFLTGGFSILLDGLYRSYSAWPPLVLIPSLSVSDGISFLELLDSVMAVGLRMIAPIVIAILVADLILAYLARMAPRLHVFDLSLAIKNLIFAILMVLYVAYIIPRMISDLSVLHSAFNTLEGIIP